MSEPTPPLDREARRRLAIIRHVEEVTGNIAMTCRLRHQPAGLLRLVPPLPLPMNVLLCDGTPSPTSASGGRSYVLHRHAQRLSMPRTGRYAALRRPPLRAVQHSAGGGG